MPITTYAIQRPSSKIYIQKYYWYYSTPVIAHANQRPSSKISIPKVLLVLLLPIIACANQRPSSKFPFPSSNFISKKYYWYQSHIPIIACAIQRPSSKFVPKSIIGVIPNTNKNLRYPAPVFKTYPQKYCWYHPHMPIIAYAIQRPSSKFTPKSIIGTIPNANKNLRHPAPVFKTYPQSIVGTIPNTNNSLRHPAPLLKSYLQKYYWYHSECQ